MKVAVTGATGFLGWHLCEGFRAQGFEVIAIVRPGNRKPLPAGIATIEAPLTAGALAHALPSEVSLVVHAAGLTHARDQAAYDAVNVEGTRAVVDSVRGRRCRVILISSQAAAGLGTAERPRREEDVPRPITAYGRSKLAAEAVVNQSGLASWTILRPSAIYGPRDRQFLPLFRLATRGLFPLASSPTAAYTVIHVDDVVRAAIAAAAHGPANGRTMFVGHPAPVTTTRLLETLASAVGRPYRPRQVPRLVMRALAAAGEWSWKLGRKPLVDDARFTELYAEGWVCAVDQLRQVLGVAAAIDLPEGLRQTAEWYKDEGWL